MCVHDHGPGSLFTLFRVVYTNCLLVTLNSREYIRYGGEAQLSDTLSMPSFIVNQDARTVSTIGYDMPGALSSPY